MYKYFGCFGILVLLAQPIAVSAFWFSSLFAGAFLETRLFIVLAWAGLNVRGDLKRGVVLAMAIGISNLGGVCSSFIYVDPPRFHIEHGTNMGFISLSKKEAQCLAENIGDNRRYEFKDIGDASLLFRNKAHTYISFVIVLA
ncbi:hypothetical protein EV424DRAFT_1354320 [Suillus variegatus]|nr:hypothetical protein EV424DRAFT_1354320 [Suillus variegatus]